MDESASGRATSFANTQGKSRLQKGRQMSRNKIKNHRLFRAMALGSNRGALLCSIKGESRNGQNSSGFG